MTQVRNSKGAATCEAGMAELMDPRFFKALCDPNRIALLIRLAACGKPCTVTEIACCCPTDLSVVSRHLAVLRDAGVLICEKRGKEVFYAVRYDDLAGTLRAIADAIEGCCGKPKKGGQASSKAISGAKGTNQPRGR